MDISELSQLVDIKKEIEKLHLIVTEKFHPPSNGFDAWYTNKPYVLLGIVGGGSRIAQKLRMILKYLWAKEIPKEVKVILKKPENEPVVWEESPDGVFAGIAILLAGWVANQYAAKLRDNPNSDCERILKDFRLLINKSMELGIDMTKDGK
jgi:hypothetical protein